MELRRYLALIRQRLWFVIAALAIAVLAGILAAPSGVAYASSSTIYVGARQFNYDDATLSGDRASAVSQLSQTFAKMIDSEPIAAGALSRTQLQLSADSVVSFAAAKVVAGTNLIQITVTMGDPLAAQTLADALAAEFVDQVVNFEPSTPGGEGSLPSLPAYVFERADLPSSPLPSSGFQTLFLMVMFTLAASIGLIFLLDYLDVTIKTSDDAERNLSLPVLGELPYARNPIPRLAHRG